MGEVKDKSLIRSFGVQFDLPYLLRVEDSFEAETVPEGYTDYQTVADGTFPIMLRFKKAARITGGAEIWTEDTRGALCYSQVQVWYDRRFFERYPIETSYSERWDEMSGLAIAAVNLFAENYRELTGAWWVRPVVQSEVMYRKMFVIYNDGTVSDTHLGELGTSLGAGKLISKRIDDELRRQFRSGHRLDPLPRFSFAVTEFLDKQNYWSTVMSTAVYFEAAFAQIVRTNKIDAGVSAEEVDAWFLRADGMPRSITSKVKGFIREITGEDAENTDAGLHPAYAAWCTDVRDLRNDLAHGTRLDVGADQALGAVDAVNSLLRELAGLAGVVRDYGIFLGPPCFD